MAIVTKPGPVSPDLAADADSVAPARPAGVRFGMRSGTVRIYLWLAAITLLPGLLLWLRPDAVLGWPRADAWLQTLRRALSDIHFGGGLRFWFGVAGASMMALLLLYPVRKALAQRRALGSVAAWFHLHIAFGIAGPVLVLYHCNFGHGAPDANVALWTMLSVVASGIVGQFIYASVSATFYANKQAAREQLEAIGVALLRLDAAHPTRQKIITDLASFDAALLTPRRGIFASIGARLRMERRRSALARAIDGHISTCAGQLAMSDAEQRQVRGIVGRHFGAYMRIARHAASRSLREQVWARWRLFHMPAFLLMVVATVLHVSAVWNLGDGSGPKAVPYTIDPAPAGARPVPGSASSARTAKATPDSKTAWGTRRVKTLSTTEDANTDTLPVLKAPPTLARRPASQSPAQQPGISLPQPSETSTPPTQPLAIPQPVAKNPAAVPATDAIAELQRRLDDPPPATASVKPRTLADQIAALKLRQQNKQFAHSQVETGFPLTGQHKALDCADCHTKPLSEPIAASTSPRQCVNCHRKDDVHRGRRLNCASCHTTTRWSDIIRE